MATTVSQTANESRPMTEEADFLQIKSIDHIHFYVGNAKQAMYYWWKAFGFKPIAYSGLETGNRDFASYVLESGQARFVISAPYTPSSPLAAHHLLHGDGVKMIARSEAALDFIPCASVIACLSVAPSLNMKEPGAFTSPPTKKTSACGIWTTLRGSRRMFLSKTPLNSPLILTFINSYLSRSSAS